ncbi:MAG: hypothetical protein IKU27_06930 [Clostridia bacterium]|nr:hypothetical protein [Clostridia bacterium]
MTTERKLYLSEAVNYDRDIAPHQFIMIYAGVGSGKNYMIDGWVSGSGEMKHEDGTPVEKKHVLLITSRRAKVNEQLALEDIVYDPKIGMFDDNVGNWVFFEPKYEDYYESETVSLPISCGRERKVYKRSAVNTNAKIEALLKYTYTPAGIDSCPWKRFDMIVVDEAHSLLADASYQSSPFYVRRFIEETLANDKDCKVIAMTGTPDILENDELFSKAHLLDMRDICINVVPKKIEFITKEQARDKQMQLMRQGEKFISFSNHISTLLDLAENAPASVKPHIAVSFSKQEKLQALKKKDEVLHAKMKATEDYLAEHQMLPDDVKFFLTTARNKEGINIKNKDIKVMFIEAHAGIDICQMAGRVREGLDVAYIIVDSIGHDNDENPAEQPFSKDPVILAAMNEHLNILKLQNDDFDPETYDEGWRLPLYRYENLKEYIDFVHERLPYMICDYIKEQFDYYEWRSISKAYYQKVLEEFEEAAKTKAGLMALADSWFPGIECQVRFKPRGDIEKGIEELLEKYGWKNGEVIIAGKDRPQFLRELRSVAESRSQAGWILKQYGYKWELENHKAKCAAQITKEV